MRHFRLPAAHYAEITPTLERSLTLVRWSTVAALFILSLSQPLFGRTGLPSAALVLIFAVYGGALALLRLRVRSLRSRALCAVLDLVVVTELYSVTGSPGGTIFILLLLVTVWAAATVSLRQSLVHTIAAMLVAIAVAPALPGWVRGTAGIRDLAGRLIVLALASMVTALLVRRIEQEHDAVLSSRADAEHQAEVNRLTGVFIASVSHDLRTPLTALRSGLGMLEMSTRDSLRPDEAQLLAAARRNSERLNLLIDDLLTYNQLEARELRLAPEPMQLDVVATAAVATLEPMLAEKRQHLRIEVPTPLPCRGDARKLEQVVVNLVANAITHTPPGTRIGLSGAATPDEALLTVADDGPGMPPAELERIFERFQTLAPASGGSGLGLSIARSIVELHGGRIWAESTPGAGTRIHVALPLDASHITNLDIADATDATVATDEVRGHAPEAAYRG